MRNLKSGSARHRESPPVLNTDNDAVRGRAGARIDDSQAEISITRASIGGNAICARDVRVRNFVKRRN
jgi:hypothetical protein